MSQEVMTLFASCIVMLHYLLKLDDPTPQITLVQIGALIVARIRSSPITGSI